MNRRHTRFALLLLLCVAVPPVCLLVAAGRAAADPRPAVQGAIAPEELERLIEQLGSPEYIVRTRAEKQLLRLGFDAFDALQAAEDHDDIEISARASYLAQQIKIEWVREEDPAEVKRLFEHYEELNEPQRQDRINKLSKLSGDEGLPALCRIVRYERAQLLSKLAALAILEQKPLDDDRARHRDESIQKNLGRSNRAGARWLRTQILGRAQPEAALAQWTQLIDQEERTRQTHPADSATEIVAMLMRQKVDLLKQLDRRDEAVAVMLKMIELQDGQPDTLAELIGWLAGEKAWDLIDQVVERYGGRIESSGLVLHALADARAQQGDEAKAKEIVARALKLDPGNAGKHAVLASALQQRGLVRGAEAEYRLAIDIGPETSQTSVVASLYLAEMLHDLGREGDAGAALKKLDLIIDKYEQMPRLLARLGREPGSVRSRMDYFFAQQARLDKDTAKQRELLDRAIGHDPTDADVLIAMYRLQEADEAYRSRVRELIKKAAAEFKRQVEENPDDSSPYNQYAWLVGNTEGDFDEAIEFSHKSLVIRPGSAGYLDTLAHCYFTKGDYANAVKYQQQAANSEPHTKVITSALERFKKALEESKQKP